MWIYIITLFVYMLSYPLGMALTGSLAFALFLKIILLAVLLYFFRKYFRFRLRLDWLAIASGIAITVIWVALEGHFPLIGKITLQNYTLLPIILKVITGVLFAPVIEEFFTRFFLLRWIIDKNWEKVKLGAYTHSSFIITVLFFGFSHIRWLPGIITGVILNLLFYKRKNIDSVILAHMVANLLLAAYIIYTGSWQFW